MFNLSFLPPLSLFNPRRSRSTVSRSCTPTAKSSDKSSDENIQFIIQRIEDIRNLVSSPSFPSLLSLSDLPSGQSLPSWSALQRLISLSTFRALSPNPLDHLCPIPTEPAFDPILALNLAIYAFRAYHDPSTSAYRETLVTPIGERYFIQTDSVYPSTEQIGTATGLFLLKVSGLDGRITARINDATVRDLHEIGNASVLRIIHPGCIVDDVLHLYFHPSADDNPFIPSHAATLHLKELVDLAIQNQEQVSQPTQTITLDPVDYDTQRIDFFQESLLPAALKLPFFTNRVSGSTLPEQAQVLTITIEVSFIPFEENYEQSSADSPPKSYRPKNQEDDNIEQDKTQAVSKAIEALGDAIKNAADEEEEEEKSLTLSERKRRDDVASVVRMQLPEGAMPDPTDWSKLAAAASNVISQIGSTAGSTKALDCDASPCLFIENEATDTEVWLFRDQRHKSLVVSFRGTEQVNWRDFFTDAQLFLQRWVPGCDIDLIVSAENTVGLSQFLPDLVATSETAETIPEEACAVHYGFLRAYLSVRDALDRGISLLNEKERKYKILFTGHSLGGALATLAAVDFVARKGGEVCCMSYGAPKVGNFNFAKRFNELVPNAFRIVNDSDLVSRMPRSAGGGRAVERYKHSGRTVLVNDFGNYWIEGENDEEIIAVESSMTNPFRERFKDLNELFQHERELWEQLLSGISVKHHMEDSYFTAIQQVVRRVAEDLDEREEKKTI